MTQIKYDFGSGRSDPETFPVAALQAAANKVIEEQAEALTQYPGDLRPRRHARRHGPA